MLKRNKLIALIAGASASLLLLAGGFALHATALGKVVPSYYYGGINLGLNDRALAESKIAAHYAFLSEDAEVTVKIGDESKKYKYADLSYQIQVPDDFSDLPIYGESVNFGGLLVSLFKAEHFPIRITPNQAASQAKLYDDFSEIKRSSSPSYQLNEAGELITVEGKMGREVLADDLYKKMRESLMQTHATPASFSLTAEVVEPSLTTADILKKRDLVEALIAKSIGFNSSNSDEIIYLDAAELLSMMHFEENDGELTANFDDIAFAGFVQNKLAEAFTDEVGEVKITYNQETGRASFEGNYGDGTEILFTDLLAEFNKLLIAETESNEVIINVPTHSVKGRVTTDEYLASLGVNGLYASGHTSFYGSPANRMHNIGVGLDTYNGMIIEPGEVFSFNDNLGEVDGSTGYLPELVIKPEGTIPEYGGGLCQVSTTLYRAVLNADLPVLERNPHSYAVSYYAQQLGHGLDATIYPGASDLKFENTTNTPLVIESFRDGANAYFRLYGSNNDTVVSYDGPYVSRYVSPGAAINIPDGRLAPGTKKQVEKAHTGFDVLWYKTVTYADGTSEKKEIFSRYKAIPAKYLVGPSVPVTNDSSATEELSFLD